MKQTDLSKQSVNFGAGGLRNSLKSIQKSPSRACLNINKYSAERRR